MKELHTRPFSVERSLVQSLGGVESYQGGMSWLGAKIVDLSLKFIQVREIMLEEEGKRPALSQWGKSKTTTVVVEWKIQTEEKNVSGAGGMDKAPPKYLLTSVSQRKHSGRAVSPHLDSELA